MNGKIVQVQSCGMFVDHHNPWLAGSPDAIVIDSSEVKYCKGCLEVKCPYVCHSRSIKDACKEVNGFCLVVKDGTLQLSKSHMYFYQVQTQMHVTGLQWCDFFMWSRVGDPFLQRIVYDSTFMNGVLVKAKLFYFNIFLPAVASYFVIKSSASNATSSPCDSDTCVKDSTMKDSVGDQPHCVKKQVNDCNRKDREQVAKKDDISVEDLQLVAVYTKPPTCLQNLQTLLEYLNLKRHSVKGDGSCLYHAVAHQAGLITTYGTGDDIVSGHLRYLALLTM